MKSPMLTGEAEAAVHNVWSHRIAMEAVRAFLAAQDREALARHLYEQNVVGPSLGRAVIDALLGDA